MSVSSLPAEARLLLLTAGGRELDPALTSLLDGTINWDKLSLLADREQAAPVLLARLTELRPELEIGAALRRLAMVSAFHLRLLQRRLYETIAALDAAGIEAVLLKGAGLGHSAYPAFTDRPMGDIDLLVARECIPAAREVLLASGWAGGSKRHSDEVYRGHQHLPPFYDANGTPVWVELHTDFCSEGHPFRLAPEAVLARARRLTVEGRTVVVPEVHDQLLHACIHFAWGHLLGSGSWRTFRDVGAIAASGQVDWEEFTARARQSRGGSCCFWTFQLARAVAAVEVPEPVMQALRPEMSGTRMRALERHFIRSLLPSSAACPSVRLRNLMWRLGIEPGRSGHGRALPWAGTRRQFRIAPPKGSRLGALLGRALRHAHHARRAPGYLMGLLRV